MYKAGEREGTKTAMISLRPSAWMACLSWATLLVLASPVHAELIDDAASPYVLQQIHVITRHGARQPLTKESSTLLENDGVGLTPLGYRQHYYLGELLRQRYDPTTVLGSGYDPANHKFESSHLDRTLSSANALALGVFGKDSRSDQLQMQGDASGGTLWTAQIPVYSTADNNDITIRAYKNCPKFQEKLVALYQSQTWRLLRDDHMPLLQRLAVLFPEDAVLGSSSGSLIPNYVALEQLWDVYDMIHVAKTECTDATNPLPSCSDFPDASTIAEILTDDEWFDLQQLTHEVELLKYGTSTAGNWLGSNLIRQILMRIENGVGSFFHYSAHYPTLLGVFATLRSGVPLTAVPDYASAMVVEVHRHTVQNELYIRILYHEGAEQVSSGLGDTWDPMDLDAMCPNDTDDDGFCPLTAFNSWLIQNIILSDESWCSICNNFEANVCLKAAWQEVSTKLANIPTQNPFPSSYDDSKIPGSTSADEFFNSQSNKDSSDRQQLIGGVLGAFFGGMFVGIFALAFLQCCGCCSSPPSPATATDFSAKDMTAETTADPMDVEMTRQQNENGVMS